MKYKSLFIDLDDTLWDTYHNNKECLEEVYTAHHFDRYYASFEAFFDIYWPHNNLLWEQYRNNEIDRQTLIIERFRHMLRPLGIEDTKSVLEINNDFLQRTTRKTRLVPGAIELLEYLRPSYRMYIHPTVSGKSSSKTQQFGPGPLFRKDDPFRRRLHPETS